MNYEIVLVYRSIHEPFSELKHALHDKQNSQQFYCNCHVIVMWQGVDYCKTILKLLAEI